MNFLGKFQCNLANPDVTELASKFYGRYAQLLVAALLVTMAEEISRLESKIEAIGRTESE